MSTEPQPRPPQATLAGALIIGGSVVLILAAWQRISTLHTLEVQQGLERWLDANNLEGMTVDGLVTTLRVLCLVGAGAAAASAILGFQVFQRSASARMVLAALAPLLLIGAFASTVVVGLVAVFGISLLWSQPTRDWYAGRPWVQRHEERRAARLGALRPGPSATQPPPAQQGSSQQPLLPPHPPQPSPEPQAPGFGLPHVRPLVVRRPGALVAACTLAWVLSALAALAMTVMAVAVGAAGGELFEELRKQQPDLVESSRLTEKEFVASFLVVAVGLALWAVAALVLATLAFIGQNWARITLAVSSVCAALLTLVMAISAPPLVVVAGALAFATWLLLRPDVAQWYSQRR